MLRSAKREVFDLRLSDDEIDSLPMAFARINLRNNRPVGRIRVANANFKKYFFEGVHWADRARLEFAPKDSKASPFKKLKSGVPSKEVLDRAGAIDCFYDWDAKDSDPPTHYIEYEYPEFLHRIIQRELRTLPTWRRDFRWTVVRRKRSNLFWIDDVSEEMSRARDRDLTTAAGASLIKRVHTRDDAESRIAYRIDQKSSDGLGGDFFFQRWTIEKRHLVTFVGDAAGSSLRGALTSLMAGVKLTELCQTDELQEDMEWLAEETEGNLASWMLNEVDRFLEGCFKETEGGLGTGIGIDGVLCVFDTQSQTLYHSDGNFQLWRVRDGKVTDVTRLSEDEESEDKNGEHEGSAPDRKTIGAGWEGAFSFDQLEYDDKDMFFAASDGVFDQLSPGVASNPTRFTRKRFEKALKKLARGQPLSELADKCGFEEILGLANEYCEHLRAQIENHMSGDGTFEKADQNDDRLIVGIVPWASEEARKKDVSATILDDDVI